MPELEPSRTGFSGILASPEYKVESLKLVSLSLGGSHKGHLIPEASDQSRISHLLEGDGGHLLSFQLST